MVDYLDLLLSMELQYEIIVPCFELGGYFGLRYSNTLTKQLYFQSSSKNSNIFFLILHEFPSFIVQMMILELNIFIFFSDT